MMGGKSRFELSPMYVTSAARIESDVSPMAIRHLAGPTPCSPAFSGGVGHTAKRGWPMEVS